MFKVYVSKKALKSLEKVPQSYKRRVLELLKVLERDPLPEGYDLKKLKGFESAYRIRIGKYRVVYEVNWEERKVLVVFIGHRSDAY